MNPFHCLKLYWGGGDGDGRRVGLEGLGMVGHVAPPPGPCPALTCSNTACRSSWTYWCYPSCQCARTCTGHQFIWRLKSRDTQPTTQWKWTFLWTLNLFTPRCFSRKKARHSRKSCSFTVTPPDTIWVVPNIDKWVSELQICTKLGKQMVNDVLSKQDRKNQTRKWHWNSGDILPSAGHFPPLQGKPEQLQKTKKQNPLWICTTKLFLTKLISVWGQVITLKIMLVELMVFKRWKFRWWNGSTLLHTTLLCKQIFEIRKLIRREDSKTKHGKWALY